MKNDLNAAQYKNRTRMTSEKLGRRLFDCAKVVLLVQTMGKVYSVFGIPLLLSSLFVLGCDRKSVDSVAHTQTEPHSTERQAVNQPGGISQNDATTPSKAESSGVSGPSGESGATGVTGASLREYPKENVPSNGVPNTESEVASQDSGPSTALAANGHELDSESLHFVSRPTFEDLQGISDRSLASWNRYCLMLDSGPVLIDFLIAIDGHDLATQAQIDAQVLHAEIQEIVLDKASRTRMESPISMQPTADELGETDSEQEEEEEEEGESNEQPVAASKVQTANESSASRESPNIPTASSGDITTDENTNNESSATDIPNEDDTRQEFSWKLALADDFLTSGFFPNLLPESEDQSGQVIDQYDENDDGLVDPLELLHWLTRGLTRGELTKVAEANQYRFSNRDNSPIFQQIDSDGNSEIDQIEIERAVFALRQLDRNSDGLIALTESQPVANSGMQNMTQRRLSVEPLLVDAISATADSLFRTRLSDQYNSLMGFVAAEWPNRPELFEELDGNEDGELQRAEILALRQQPCDLLIVIEHTSESLGKQSQTAKEVPDHEVDPTMPPTSSQHAGSQHAGSQHAGSQHAGSQHAGSQHAGSQHAGPEIRMTCTGWIPQVSVSQETRTRTHLSIDDFSCRVDASDTITFSKSTMRASILAQLRIPEDGDTPVDTQTFFATENVRASTLDFDQDGLLTAAEVEKAIELLGMTGRSLSRLRLVDAEDAWFSRFDIDNNQLLTEPEVRVIPDILKTIADSGTPMYSTSTPMAFRLIASNMFSVQDAFSNSFTNQVSQVNASQRQSESTWFEAMDLNGDDYISRREFLGDRTQFQAIDGNEDGLISRMEANSTDPSVEIEKRREAPARDANFVDSLQS